MKKIVLILTVALLAAACDVDFERPRDNPDRENKAVYNIDIDAEDWIWNASDFVYTFSFNDIEALTPYVIDNGLYSMYFKWMDGNMRMQESMPIILYREDEFGLWECSISCAYSDNTVKYYVRNSDLGSQRPDSMSFRLVITW